MNSERIQNGLHRAAVIAEPNRMAIVSLLKGGEMCACDIHPRLGLAQNQCSHHLKVLREAGLVHRRRDGVRMMYSRNEDTIREYVDQLHEMIG